MPSYNVNDLIGKTFKAASEVDLKRFAADNAPVIYTAKKGSTIGVVDSYLMPKEGRSDIYLMFYDNNNKPYYMALTKNSADINMLTSQGLTTLEQQAKEEARKNETTKDFIARNLKNIALIFVGGMIVKEVVSNKIKA
jgi:hypothetical protein